jgi:threonine aldolase
MHNSRAIDLRSDFLAHPTERMLDAYRAAATSGAYGLREDPLQRELEAKLAALLGCEDALIFPTCTMANQAALLLQTSPGDTVVCQESAHILTSEAGGAAAWGGLTLRTVPGQSVEAPIERWLEHARQLNEAAQSNPSLCCFENTHNRLGGGAASAGYCAKLAQALRDQCGVKLHLDGARILYAAAALATAPAALASPFDTVSISLNKGLGSPIAAALAGNRHTIKRAERVRQRLGGGIRPVAAGAAAALAALEDRTHLGDDIRRAKDFAARLRGCARLDFESWPTVSNLVFFELKDAPFSAGELASRCAARGLLINAASPVRLRAVFYRGITDAHVEQAAGIIEGICA